MSRLTNGVLYELSLTVLSTLCIYMDKTGAHPYSFERTHRSLYRAVALHCKYLWMFILLVKKKKIPVFPWECCRQRDGEKGNYSHHFCLLILLNNFWTV